MHRAAPLRLVAILVTAASATTLFAGEIDVPAKDMNGDAAGNINVLTNADSGVAGQITATYEPPDGKTLSEAAEQLWGGHLNWVNIVVSGTPGATPDDPDGGGSEDYPLLDPLPGGNSGGSFVELDADDLPFYLDENNDNDDGGASAQDLSDNAFEEFGLIFQDQPQYGAEVMWKFNTYLASIQGEPNASTEKTFHIVAGFMWTFTEDAEGNRTITNLMPITIDKTTIGAHAKLVNDTMDEYSATKMWQATSHIPEPMSGAILMFVTMFACCRRGASRNA